MSGFDFRDAEILDCPVYQKSGLEITILTADHRHPWDGIEISKGQTPEKNPEVHENTDPWNTKVLGYVRKPSTTRDPGPIVANCEAFLVKRDLIIHTADEYSEFYNLIDRNSQVLGWLGHEIFDSEGRLRAAFKGQGIWGADSDESWILMITKILVDHKLQHQGIGRELVGALLGQVLLWAAQQNPPRAVLTIAEPSVLREERERFQRTQRQSPGDIANFIESSLERAKKFWRSWGFVQLGDTKYFGWRRPAVPDPALQLPPVQGGKRWDEMAADLEILFGGEAEARRDFYRAQHTQ
ncbi:hypothetical protein KVR01_005043 [Diaporthe batatas]|uniref:uncharacterized protein n=1 Tax=Diaporthe batatas TaxID=748121 RepID=UPI001D047EB7|nr:uncharacterized protein KVR01_005043 [Diaporthe batatas]KAG8164768.1 hypothetical protein KVR01_005043 [Diaporthe batatas]